VTSTSAVRLAARLLVAAALATTAAGPRAAESDAAVRDGLVRLSQELMDAIASGKAEVWARLLDEDAIVIDEFGRRQTKRQAVDDLKPLPAGLTGSIEVRDAHVRRWGDTAVIDFEGYEQETVFDQRLLVRYRFVATWIRRGGAWRLAAMEDVTVPTEPPELAVAGLRLDDYPGTYRYGPGRQWVVQRRGDALVYVRRDGKDVPLRPVALDVFFDGSDEKNLIVFRRDAAGRVNALVERRKYNDLHMTRQPAAEGRSGAP
jgi:hypothetical protein